MKDSQTGKDSLWQRLWSPSARWSVGALLAAGIVVGVVGWMGFDAALTWTNTEKFCLSCHEMRDNVYQEYRGTIHDINRTGVRAVCADCHVPKPLIAKLVRKVKAAKEVWGKATGSVDTREKFENERIRLALNEWKRMKESDSRECRSCHVFDAFDLARQQKRAQVKHTEAETSGETCIDCHKGIAHRLPAGAYEAEAEFNKKWAQSHKR